MSSETDHDLLIRLSVQLETLTNQLGAHMTHVTQLYEGHELRLRALEQWKWRWAGAVAVLVLLVNIFGNVLSRAILPSWEVPRETKVSSPVYQDGRIIP